MCSQSISSRKPDMEYKSRIGKMRNTNVSSLDVSIPEKMQRVQPYNKGLKGKSLNTGSGKCKNTDTFTGRVKLKR
jgi:hypothetical protein